MTEELTALAKVVKETKAAELATRLEIQMLELRLRDETNATMSATHRFGKALETWQDSL